MRRRNRDRPHHHQRHAAPVIAVERNRPALQGADQRCPIEEREADRRHRFGASANPVGGARPAVRTERPVEQRIDRFGRNIGE